MNRRYFRTLHFISLILLFVLIVGQKQSYAQKKITTPCILVSDNSNVKNQKLSGIQLENNTPKAISLVFEFDNNGFYDQETLRAKIMQGTDSKKSKEFNQLLILDNIAHIIKSSNHRNFNLLFSDNSPTVTKKKYSSLSMITSFYDKQCNDYQRLAAQMAILTPYFQWQDFKAYYIIRHVVLDVKIGKEFIFHDFDPGEPGYRFYRNADSLKYASLTDLLNNVNLIKKEQFYTYNNVSLCPWISESYYRSLFGKFNGKIDYTDIDDVYGFIPQWTIPSNTKILFSFPDTTTAVRFGAKVHLNKHESLVRKAFGSYKRYKAHHKEKDILKINLYMTKYLEKNFKFGYDMNYFYLINAGLLSVTDNNNNVVTFKDKYVNVSLSTNDDTVFFLKDFFIPLPLRQVNVKQGKVSISEAEFIENHQKDYQYDITDSLVFDLYNYAPPIVTCDKERRPLKIEAASLIYGPSRGYILPHSIVEFEYYYNPFYYTFHNLNFKMRNAQGCDEKLDVKPVSK